MKRRGLQILLGSLERKQKFRKNKEKESREKNYKLRNSNNIPAGNLSERKKRAKGRDFSKRKFAPRFSLLLHSSHPSSTLLSSCAFLWPPVVFVFRNVVSPSPFSLPKSIMIRLAFSCASAFEKCSHDMCEKASWKPSSLFGGT